MKLIKWGLQLLIPIVVLFTIGYYVPGFSALTIPWIIALSVIIALGEWLINKAIIGKFQNRFASFIIDFLVATVVIFSVTLAIEGGNVPFGSSLLAAATIAILTELINPNNVKAR